jgi:hypothetical protein
VSNRLYQVNRMRWIKVSSFVCLCWMVVASCGGDDDDTGSEMSSAIKLDGSRLAGCLASADCKNDLVCYGAITSSTMATAGFCTDACNADPTADPFAAGNLCPDISGQAASCSPEGQCRIDCTGGGSGDGKCPTGMECRDTDPNEMRMTFRCAYPIGTKAAGSRKKLWDECNPAHVDADCESPNICVASGTGQNRRGFCSAPCTMDGECSAPSGATARPLCAASLEACSLDCADGASCPRGMDCIDTTPGDQVTMRCRFVPPGTMQPADMPAGDMPAGDMPEGDMSDGDM